MKHKNIIDTNSLINSKNKSSKNWIDHNFLFKKVSKILGNKLGELGDHFENILILSPDAGETSNEITKNSFTNVVFLSPYRNLLEKDEIDSKNIFKTEGSFENLPFKSEKFDLIISNLYLHNIDQKELHFKRLYELLNKNGLLMCNFFGEKTMYELRNSLLSTDEKLFKGAFMRILSNPKMVDISDLLSISGFKELVSEKISFKIYYSNAKKILEDLKGIGENKILKSRQKGLMTNNYLKILNNEYAKKYMDDNGLRLTCDIISISCWKNKS
tara:strand:+ start:44 stop:859 length:816 start_codon:yes stop_codon:yes gene_type:complete